MEGQRTYSAGFATLEATAWLLGVLPFVVAAAIAALYVHDQRVLAVIPEALLREISLPTLSWTSNGSSAGEFRVEAASLRAAAGVLAENALTEAKRSVLKTKALNARACLWVFQVDAQTGKAIAVEQEECGGSSLGELKTTLDGSLTSVLKRRVGVLVPERSNTVSFVDRAIIAGVVVSGSFIPMVPGIEQPKLRFAHVTFPRSEVSL